MPKENNAFNNVNESTIESLAENSKSDAKADTSFVKADTSMGNLLKKGYLPILSEKPVDTANTANAVSASTDSVYSEIPGSPRSEALSTLPSRSSSGEAEGSLSSSRQNSLDERHYVPEKNNYTYYF